MPARSYKLVLEYDGTAFAGWQSQKNGRTVQAELEKALAVALRRPVKVTASGRTDSGVHARGQVAGFESESPDPEPQALMGNLNGLMPADVRVRELEWAPHLFDARRDAIAKTYRYVWLNRRASSPFWDRVSWHQARPLDVEAMAQAAACLVGQHDFSAFRAAECSAKTPLRRVLELNLHRRGERVVMDIRGQAFLQHMVRNIAGSLTEVGLGKRPAAWIEALLKGRDRTQAGPTAPAKGLCLWCVDYGEIPRPGRFAGKKA
jgi:tRNA pseudouridine38-40 synthase